MRLLHRNILVRRYVKPERLGSLILPEAYRGDRTQTLWEVEAAGPCVAEPCAACRMRLHEQGGEAAEWAGLGATLRRDDIIITLGWTAVEVPRLKPEDGDRWIVDARFVRGVYFVREAGEDEGAAPGAAQTQEEAAS